MAITIERPVTVKAVVTEGLKADLRKDLEEALARISDEINQIEFEGRRLSLELERQNPARTAAFRQQLEEERQKRLAAREDLQQKTQAVSELELGTEIIHSQVTSLYEVQVGDDWEKIAQVEIVIKDSKVIEIREGNAR
jgi:hypothetical protein